MGGSKPGTTVTNGALYCQPPNLPLLSEEHIDNRNGSRNKVSIAKAVFAPKLSTKYLRHHRNGVVKGYAHSFQSLRV
jgi:hypothetical protein